MFYYCENCRKIKNWYMIDVRDTADCSVCGAHGEVYRTRTTPANAELTKCPDPCQGDCKLCPLPASLPESDEGDDSAEMGPKTLGDIIKEYHERNGETRVDVDGGKYTVIISDKGGLSALRHGEPWQKEELVGNNLVYCLASELDTDRKKLALMMRLAETQEKTMEMFVNRIKKLEAEIEESALSL